VHNSDIYYCEPVFRPPSEAYSLLIQVTEGCTFNCSFCISNVGKKFKIRQTEEIKKDLETARKIYGKNVRRIFFLDGNAFIIKPDMLIELTQFCYQLFSNLERVSAYAHAKDILRKSDEELAAIRAAGFKMVYLGIETGDDLLLKHINKQTSAEELAQAAQKLHKADITLSGTVILGLAGSDPDASKKHAIATGQLINHMAPSSSQEWYISALTLMIAPGSLISTQVAKNEFFPGNSKQALEELRIMINEIDPTIKNLIFRSNHASNYLPLKGTLAQDKQKLLDIIEFGLNHPENLRPEYYRGL
jgi:radical SAM superfamily enzyme YgiQ (UPF0313 family)